MHLKIRHGILELNDNTSKHKKISSIVINDEFILTSATILSTYFSDIFKNETAITYLNKLRNFQVVNFSDDHSKLDLNFQITYDQKSIKTLPTLTKFPAELLYWFNSPDIQNSVDELFKYSDDENVKDTSDENVLLASFLLLRVRNTNSKYYSITRLLTELQVYLKFIPQCNKLDDTLTICTPFGEAFFYKTLNIGKISNVFGVNNSLFLLSNSLPFGCEGSAVFNRRLRLIGLIIFTSFYRQGENVNLTCAASFGSLLKHFMQQMGVRKHVFVINEMKILKLSNYEKSLVSIYCNGSFGTGTIVNICDKLYVLTCSHVIKKDCKTIKCHHFKGEFTSEVIWQHHRFNEPFDVALLTAPQDIARKYAAQISDVKPQIGQQIYAAGFAILPIGDKFTPSVYEGRIVKYSAGVIISDACLQAGQSGGPLFDENGGVIGICVANTKMDNTIYPHVNISIPLELIRGVLEKYAKTNDYSVLSGLIAGPEVKEVWRLEHPTIISKL